MQSPVDVDRACTLVQQGDDVCVTALELAVTITPVDSRSGTAEA